MVSNSVNLEDSHGSNVNRRGLMSKRQLSEWPSPMDPESLEEQAPIEEKVHKERDIASTARIVTQWWWSLRYITHVSLHSTFRRLIENSFASNLTVWIVGSIVIWLIAQATILEISMHATEKRSIPLNRHVYGSHDFADETAKAYNEWKLIQQQFTGRYANFSQYLIKEKMKERNLRMQLSKLSQKALDMASKIIVPPVQPPPAYSEADSEELRWKYLSMEKAWPYVGSDRYLDRYSPGHRHYYNSLAVFAHANATRLHGVVGMYPDGTRAWHPDALPPPIDEFPGGKGLALKDGGFYLNLSNALPLDRDNGDTRDDFCGREIYEIEKYEDVSIIITFYNEHLSTLLRSIHSVLNHTPPPLLREIVLVDDHSNNSAVAAGGFLEQYIKLLPKVKLMRLSERRGLVQARVAGARVAQAPVLVVLDSHVEVNPVWLEPQLKRIYESPRSVVFPQIMAMDPETLEWRTDSGIGCFLSFKWIMQERPYFGKESSAKAVPSPSMAGGLFAVRRDWFFESGAYDEEFSMWGAENVEMAFRIWMCGGRVECTPCARTYHIYRQGGSGYSSPEKFIKKNRIRTARLWLDEYWQISKYFTSGEDVDEGSYDKMLELKKKLNCKPFQWFLDNVDPGREGTSMDDYGIIGSLRTTTGNADICLDNMSSRKAGDKLGLYPCHNKGGSQGWFELKSTGQIKNMSNENTCVGNNFTITHCDQKGQDDRWRSNSNKKWITWAKDGEIFRLRSTDYLADYECMGVVDGKLALKRCIADDPEILWAYNLFQRDSLYKPLEISAARQSVLRKRGNFSVST